MAKNSKVQRHNWILWGVSALIVIVTLAISAYLILHGRQYFNRRILRSMQGQINSYGILSPFVVLFFIFISTAIPPLPLPVPLIEIAAGLTFGFWQGFFIVWMSQILSSLFAFLAARFMEKRLLKNFFNNKIFLFYRQYLNSSGPVAVFIMRATMGAPFNIISYLAGLTQMKLLNFSLATILGTIPEAILFVFIGSIFKTTRLSLFRLFILVVIVGAIGPIVTLVMIHILQPRMKKKTSRFT